LDRPKKARNLIHGNVPGIPGKSNVDRDPEFMLVEKELLEEVDPQVVRYFKSIPLAMEDKVLYLSSTRHYIFDAATLWDVTTIINLRLINRISHIYYFLYNTNRMLPMNGYYLGCVENMTQQKRRIRAIQPGLPGTIAYLLFYTIDGLLPKIPVLRNLYLLANKGRLKCLTNYEFVKLLMQSGFLLMNITTINNVEYFVAKKVKSSKKENLRFWTLLFDYKHHSKIVKL